MKKFKKIKDKFLSVFYNLPRILFINFYRIFVVRIRVFNKVRIPDNRSLIFAFNHTTGVDPIIVLGALRKKIYFLAGSDRFKNRFSAFFMRNFTNSIPIFKEEFIKNFKTFKELFSLSNSRRVFFGIFPEGHLNKNKFMDRIHGGTAYLSYKTKLPIVPVYIHNLNKGFNPDSRLGKKPVWEGVFSILFNAFRRINVFIGDPIDPMAENIIGEFRELKNKNTYKEYIENINQDLSERFIILRDEADSLVGAGTEILNRKDPLNKTVKTKYATGAFNKEELDEDLLDDDSFVDSFDDEDLAGNAGNAR
jgi:1-acyl-sn-glycerol-3-phosphate acyltransferase